MLIRMVIFAWLTFFSSCYAASGTSENKILNWYDNFIFKDPSFNFQFIRTLGYTYEQGADIGESISTAKKVTDGNFNSWYEAWLETAKRIENVAQIAQQNGHAITAREAFFRASNYYRSAGFYMVETDSRPKSIASYNKSKETFMKAISSFPYIQLVKIPYEKTTLHGYLIRSEKANAPLVIVNTGFDGTAEELFFEVGTALHKRGYNTLLVEGPGQGSVLRNQHLSFRPDWEKVVSPIVDFVEKLPNINKDKIALMGISMGGYLAPRAAAFEPRIKALIANGGVYDLSAAIHNTLPPDVIPLIDNNPNAFNKIMYAEMQKNTTSRWFFENGMWAFHVNSPAAFMKKIKSYTLKNVAQNIKMPTLIVDSEADAFMKGQAKTLYEKLKSPKTFLLFTRKEAAQSHCQMGATAISNELIFDWLDKTFE